MAAWIIDRGGKPVLILDEYCFRSPVGDVTSWLFGNGVYALNGDHVGWFENSTLFDLHNKPVGTLQQASGLQPDSTLPMPLFSRRPHIPLLKGRHMRPPADEPAASADHPPSSWHPGAAGQAQNVLHPH